MKQILEFDHVSAEVEDGGCALITELCNDDNPGEYTGDTFFIRLQSWKEERVCGHPQWLRDLRRESKGRKVRVTIETVEEIK
jgi:hypothetical protein